MFWDALIWGIGVSLGATVGLMVFVFAFAAAKKWGGAVDAIKDQTERSIEALIRRNEIGEDMSDELRRIADAAERRT